MTKARDNANGGLGLILIKPSSVVNGTDNGKGTVSFSGVSTISLNNVFNSTYKSYKIVFSVTTTDNTTLNIRWRLNGSDNSTASSYLSEYHYGDSSTSAASLDTQSYGWLAYSRATSKTTGQSDIHDVSSAEVTHMITQFMRPPTNLQIYNLGTYHNQATAYDGFTVYPGAGTITGNISVYGYNK